jgi:PAS domain S-box-containing protein
MSTTFTTPHDQIEKIRVLHVEDDPDFAEMAATFIQREDDRITVETTTSASEGRDWLDHEQFDCIISDYDLPGQNGIEFLQAVREEHPDLPFILFTGKGSEEIAGDAISAGVTDYLQKGSGSSRYVILAKRVSNAVQGAKAKQELKKTLSRVTDAIYTVDSDWRITYVNEGTETVMGPKEELLGSNLWEQFPEAAEGIIWEKFHEAMETQEMKSFEVFYEPLDLWAKATAYPSPTGLTVYFQDVTERKRREKELKQQNERLEDFTGIVSHDLRNPLNIAEGRLDLAREKCENKHLDTIDGALERMNALIDELLAQAHQRGEIDDFEPVDLATMTKTCWQNVDTGEATLAVDVDRVVLADEIRLRQLLENLLQNGIKHGGETVTITIGEVDDGFHIEDDGPGIPADERDDVFEAGYSTSEEGTGYRLSIMKQVADAHGWGVNLTDSSGGGARFEVTGVESRRE